jgi:uncharacterized membrane protein
MTLTATVLKAILYRVYSSVITFTIAFLITGRLACSVAVSVTEFLTKIFSYSVFERLWLWIGGKSVRKSCCSYHDD